MNTDELRKGLQQLADQPYAPIRTDVAAARAKGRRIRLRRRAAAVTGSVLTIGTAVAVVATVLPPSGAGQVAADQHRPNPLPRRATFGWLPPGYRVKDTEVGHGVYSMTAVGSVGPPRSQYVLSLYPPGPGPDVQDGGAAKTIPAEPVNGRPAYWIEPPAPAPGSVAGHARIRIEFAPNLWGELRLDSATAGTDVRASISKVAKNIRLNVGDSAFPIQVRGLPRTFTPDLVQISTDPTVGTAPAAWQTTLRFGLMLTIRVSRHMDENAPLGLGQLKPNTTVGGHPAFHGADPQVLFPEPIRKKMGRGPETLCVYGVKELDVCYFVESRDAAKALDALNPVGGLVGLFRRTTLYGLDPAGWTTDPLG